MRSFRFAPAYVFVALLITSACCAAPPAQDARLKNAYRFERGGWTYVHLEGAPAEIGYQHGFLLAPEIDDAFKSVVLTETRGTKRPWGFFRDTAQHMLWPNVEKEYREEMQGIADGLKARGIAMDLWDVVALNGMEETADYYVPWLNAQQHASNMPSPRAPGNCSAFIATGSYTKDGKIVLAHSLWTSYLHGERWVVMFDVAPRRGYHMLYDGFPGAITSDSDFGINSAGIMIAETTITQFRGYDPKGIPEFVRARKALQYSNSIDDYMRIMRKGNNGGYANDWLIGDRKTNEIAYLELGLKHTPAWRKKDGYFISSNFAQDPAVLKDETDFDPSDMSTSPNARRVRWEEVMKEHKGKIDVALAEQFLSEHYDSYEKKQEATERSLCGHAENSARGLKVWDWGPWYPGGAAQAKATDSAMAGGMSVVARAGHPCGEDFHAAEFLAKHPEYQWQAPLLRDMKAGPWTEFRANDRAGSAESK